MKIRKRPADAVVGNRQLSARVLGLPYDRFWVDCCRYPSPEPSHLWTPHAVGFVVIPLRPSLIELRTTDYAGSLIFTSSLRKETNCQIKRLRSSRPNWSRASCWLR